MNIWILNHYATNQYFEHGGRHYEFAKYLIKAGYDVHIFCASTVHNTDKNAITDGRLCYEDTCDGIPFVFVKTRNYLGNGKQRVLNMFDYYRNVQKVESHFEKPDVIIGSSVHPLACVAAIRLGKKLGCRKIAEIRDLWPESIVAYGLKKKSNLVIKLLYWLEKWIYKKADIVVFTMEGGKNYIIEKGWDTAHGGPIDLKKVYHINNGVDLELFAYNREHNQLRNKVIDDVGKFVVTYAGSIRRVNQVDKLVDVAEILQNRQQNNIVIAVYGDGDQTNEIRNSIQRLKLENIRLMGRVQRTNIPGLLVRSSLNIEIGESNPLYRYGVSPNKLFEYMAAGKPIIMTYSPCYDLIDKHHCGVSLNNALPETVAEAIIRFSSMPSDEYASYCKNAEDGVKAYDYSNLTKMLIDIIESI